MIDKKSSLYRLCRVMFIIEKAYKPQYLLICESIRNSIKKLDGWAVNYEQLFIVMEVMMNYGYYGNKSKNGINIVVKDTNRAGRSFSHFTDEDYNILSKLNEYLFILYKSNKLFNMKTFISKIPKDFNGMNDLDNILKEKEIDLNIY